MKEYAENFEYAVRQYLDGNRDWDSVHELAVQMEWDDHVDFPAEIRRPMEELQMIFLPDSKDDPQFHADPEEIARLLAEINRLKRDSQLLGASVVADCERALEEQEERDRRDEYLKRRIERAKGK